ncbi:hypothetical protein Trydic_g14638 [Trypoxylus dichotomus]
MIRSCRNDRRFHTIVNDERSPERFTDSGVPQGSALGPAPFTIYIGNIPKLEDRLMRNIHTRRNRVWGRSPCPGRRIEYLGTILVRRITFSEYLRRDRNKAIDRMGQLYSVQSNLKLNPKTGIMLYKIHIRPILTYDKPAWVTAARSHLKPLTRMQNHCLRLSLSVPYTTTLAALKTLSSVEDPKESLNNLNRKCFQKAISSDSPAI